jgi:hypothetical protein
MAYNALIQKVDSNVVEVQDPFLFRIYYSVVYAKQNDVGYIRSEDQNAAGFNLHLHCIPLA